MKNRRLFWQVVDKIEKLIDKGAYPPGSRIPPERELAESFKVSRPTIREAIIALEVRGHVEVKNGSGVYVTEKSAQRLRKLNLSAFELTQARALIEGEAAALAATKITQEELEQLNQTLIDMKEDRKSNEADRLFHQIISNATRNSAITLSIQNLWELRDTNVNVKSAYADICSKQSGETRIREHRAIYDALKDSNSADARTAMHLHFNRLIHALFDASEAKALEEIRRKTSASRGLYSIDHLVANQ